MLVLSWNCANGIKYKLDEIKAFIDKHNPDIFFVCESELKPEDVCRILIKGYNLEIADSIQHGKSRIIAYV